ncbi:MAG TPA: EamA family transporter [Jatrophihabitantaceae bacterium]|jgi:drug/metabolite transporter (DMT)-like permease
MSITHLTHDRRQNVVGLGLALFSAATFGTSGTFADSLMNTGWTPGAVVTARIVLGAIFLTGPGLYALRGRWHLARRSLRSVLAFGLCAVAGCQFFFFNAVQHLDVGVALLLEYSGILLVVAWMWLRHGHRPRTLTIVGGVAAIVGLVLVLNPSGGNMDLLGVMWALFAACGLAVYFVMSSNSDDDALPPIALSWLAMCVGAVTLVVLDLARALPFRMHTSDVSLASHQVSWIVPVLGLSFVAAAVAYAAGIGAARLLGAKLASFAGLTEVLFAVLFAWIALGQQPTLVQLLGGVGVLVGIALVRTDEVAAPATDDVDAAPERVPA